jgi:hypothetical protein
MPGIVVAVLFGAGGFSEHCVRADWSSLQHEGGALIEDKVHGLLHAVEMDEIVLIRRRINLNNQE